MILYIGALIFLTVVAWSIALDCARDDPKFLRKHFFGTVLVGFGIGLIPYANVVVSFVVLLMIAWFVIESMLEKGKWFNQPASKDHRQ